MTELSQKNENNIFITQWNHLNIFVTIEEIKTHHLLKSGRNSSMAGCGLKCLILFTSSPDSNIRLVMIPPIVTKMFK